MIRSIYYGVLFTLAIANTSYGAVTTVISSPNSAQVDVAQPTRIAVGWIAFSNAAAKITSAQIVFRTADGKTLGTLNQPLSASLAKAGNVSFVETVLVPETIVIKAHLTGETKIFYERSFSDGASEALGTVALNIVAGAGTGVRFSSATGTSTNSFDISGLALTFEPNSPIAAVHRHEKLTAKVKIGYSSTGILNASWQVAGPNPGKSPEFRVLAEVNQLTDTSGEVVFRSPALPTFAEGVFLVRLEITTPSLPFDAPEIRYIVSDK